MRVYGSRMGVIITYREHYLKKCLGDIPNTRVRIISIAIMHKSLLFAASLHLNFICLDEPTLHSLDTRLHSVNFSTYHFQTHFLIEYFLIKNESRRTDVTPVLLSSPSYVAILSVPFFTKPSASSP